MRAVRPDLGLPNKGVFAMLKDGRYVFVVLPNADAPLLCVHDENGTLYLGLRLASCGL